MILSRPNVRRGIRGVLLALLIGQAASNLVEAVLLSLVILTHTKEVHEVVASSWMVGVLISLAVVEVALVVLFFERK